MARIKRKAVKKVRNPKPMKIAALIVSAIQDLKETKGSTPRKIAGYISFASKVSEGRVKRQVNAALKRGVQYGILRRYRGHYFLPSGDELDRANRIAVRFARLPTPAPSGPKFNVGQAAHRAIEHAGKIGVSNARRNAFAAGDKWPGKSGSRLSSRASSCSERMFDRDELSIGSELE